MQEDSLQRKLGLPAAIATAVGLVVASTTLVSLGQGFGLGGPGFIMAMLMALLINLFVAFSFAELSSLIPQAGSINYYTLPAMGRFLGILAVLSGYVIVNIFAGSAESAIPGLVVNQVFTPGVSPTLISTALILVLLAVNLLGVDVFGWVQIILTAGMIGSIVVLGITGLSGAAAPPPAETAQAFQSFNPMGWQVFSLASLGFWLFVGIEFVCPMAEEVKKPSRTIPLAMLLGLGIILVSNILYGYASLRYVPMEKLAGSASPQVDAAQAILGGAGAVWMGLVTFLASASTINSLMAAISRMLYGLAKTGQSPSCFGYLHPRFKTPWAGLLLVAFLFLVPLWLGISTVETIVTYVLAAAISWLVAYIIIHLNVIILRYRYPEAPRSFKSPLFPLPQLLGIAGMIYMVFNIYPDPAMRAQIYRYAILFLALAAVLTAGWVKLVMKKPLFAPVPLEELPRLAEAAEEGPVVTAQAGMEV